MEAINTAWNDLSSLAEVMKVSNASRVTGNFSQALTPGIVEKTSPAYDGAAQIFSNLLRKQFEINGLDEDDEIEFWELLQELISGFTPFSHEDTPVNPNVPENYLIPDDFLLWLQSYPWRSSGSKARVLKFLKSFCTYIPWGWFSLCEYRLFLTRFSMVK